MFWGRKSAPLFYVLKLIILYITVTPTAIHANPPPIKKFPVSVLNNTDMYSQLTNANAPHTRIGSEPMMAAEAVA